jgi:hypothetical protein
MDEVDALLSENLVTSQDGGLIEAGMHKVTATSKEDTKASTNALASRPSQAKSKFNSKSTTQSSAIAHTEALPQQTSPLHQKAPVKASDGLKFFIDDAQGGTTSGLQDECEMTARMAAFDEVRSWVKNVPFGPAFGFLGVVHVLVVAVLAFIVYSRRSQPDLSHRSPLLSIMGAVTCSLCSYGTMVDLHRWVTDGQSTVLLVRNDWCYTALIPIFLVSLCLRSIRLIRLAELDAYKTELSQMIPLRGAGAETRSRMTENQLRTTLLHELQAQVKLKQLNATERRALSLLSLCAAGLMLYAAGWELISVHACTSLYLHTFNCVMVLIASLVAVRWYCNLQLMELQDGFGVVEEMRLLSAVSLLLGAVHIMLETYLRLFATESTQICVAMACMFINLNTWMLASSVFALGWPVLRLNSVEKDLRYAAQDEEAFAAVLEEKMGRERFFSFVEQLFCRELVLLWNDIELFRSLSKSERTHDAAWAIYNKYLKRDSVLKVDVAAEFYYEISAQLEKAEQPPADLYDTVKQMIKVKLQSAFKRYQLHTASGLGSSDATVVFDSAVSFKHNAQGSGYFAQTDVEVDVAYEENHLI